MTGTLFRDMTCLPYSHRSGGIVPQVMEWGHAVRKLPQRVGETQGWLAECGGASTLSAVEAEPISTRTHCCGFCEGVRTATSLERVRINNVSPAIAGVPTILSPMSFLACNE